MITHSRLLQIAKGVVAQVPMISDDPGYLLH